MRANAVNRGYLRRPRAPKLDTVFESFGDPADEFFGDPANEAVSDPADGAAFGDPVNEADDADRAAYLEYLRGLGVTPESSGAIVVEKMGSNPAVYRNARFFAHMFAQLVANKSHDSSGAVALERDLAPLELICECGHTHVLQWLVEFCGVKALRNAARSARVLQSACRHDQLKTVKFLIGTFGVTQSDIIKSQSIISAMYGRGRTVAEFLVKTFGSVVYDCFAHVLNDDDMFFLDTVFTEHAGAGVFVIGDKNERSRRL